MAELIDKNIFSKFIDKLLNREVKVRDYQLTILQMKIKQN